MRKNKSGRIDEIETRFLVHDSTTSWAPDRLRRLRGMSAIKKTDLSGKQIWKNEIFSL